MTITKQLLFSLSLSFLCASCGMSKFSQCQQLFINVNQATKEVTTLNSSSNDKDLMKFNQAATALKTSAQTIASLTLKEPELIEYQSNFVKIYNNYAQATLEIIEAKEKMDRNLAKIAITKVRDNAKLEKETGEKLQAFCLSN